MEAVDPVALLLRVAEEAELRDRQDQEPDREADLLPVAPVRDERADDDRELSDVHDERAAAVSVERIAPAAPYVRRDRERLQEHAEDDDDAADEYHPGEVSLHARDHLAPRGR